MEQSKCSHHDCRSRQVAELSLCPRVKRGQQRPTGKIIHVWSISKTSTASGVVLLRGSVNCQRTVPEPVALVGGNHGGVAKKDGR